MALRIHQSLVVRPLDVQTTLTCEAKKSRLFFAYTWLDWAAGMGIANRFIPPFPEWVEGETMLAEVAMDIAIVPVHQRVNLESVLLQA